MTVIRKHICDRCGKEIPSGRGMTKVSIEDDRQYERYDLCENCADTIMTPLGVLLSGRYTPCRHCQPEHYGGVIKPLLDDERSYAVIEPESKQMYVAVFDGEFGDPVKREAYVNVKHCPMCGRRL